MNPVKNVPVVVFDHKGQLFIDELLDPGAAAVSSDLPASHDAVQSSSDPINIYRRRVRLSAEMQTVFSQLGLIRKQNTEYYLLSHHLFDTENDYEHIITKKYILCKR